MITVYGRENCGYCTKAKDFLGLRPDLEYKYLDINEAGFDKQNLVTVIAPGATTVPIIIDNGVWIGGWTDLEKKYADRAHFTSKLKESVYEITFRKADDTETTVTGTLIAAFLPPITEKKTTETTAKAPKAIDPSTVTFFNIEKNVWRSFSIDRFVSWKEVQP